MWPLMSSASAQEPPAPGGPQEDTHREEPQLPQEDCRALGSPDSLHCPWALVKAAFPCAGHLQEQKPGRALCPEERAVRGAAVMWPGAKALAVHKTGWEETRRPNLGEYWGDSLEGAVGPLVGYFLCRGVEGGGGPTIISILAA